MARWKLFPAVAFVCALMLQPAAHAGCNAVAVASISPTDPNGGVGLPLGVTPALTPPSLAHEGTTERLADVLIFDDLVGPGAGQGDCFIGGNVIQVFYSSPLSSPTTLPQVGSTFFQYFDVYDSAGALGLTLTATQSTVAFSGGAQSVINLNILHTGSPTLSAGGLTGSNLGSAVRIKNLRVDATHIAANTTVFASISAAAGLPPSTSITLPVGLVKDSLTAAAVTQAGVGQQSSGATLSTPAIIHIAENFGDAFRVGGAAVSGVLGDAATTPSSLTFDLGATLPWGVTVNFPSTIDTSAAAGAAGLTLQLRSGGHCNGPAPCSAVYDTVAAGPGLADFNITTAAVANTGANGAAPAFGVFISNPSGYGNVNLNISYTAATLVGNTSAPATRTLYSGPLLGNLGNNPLPAPNISAVSPNAGVTGQGPLLLTVTGTNFVAGSVIWWNGAPRSTTVTGATQASFTLTPSDLAFVSTDSIVVVNPDGGISNAVSFPVIASLTPALTNNYNLPHVPSGGGFVTKITIVNTAATANTVQVNFLSPSGTFLSTSQFPLSPGGTVRVATPESERFGPATTKWAVVGSAAPVLVNAFYEFIPPGTTEPINTVGFNDAPPLTDFSVPVEFEPQGSHQAPRTVGLAVANPSNSTTTVTLKLLDQGGNIMATALLTLPAFGQKALELLTEYPQFRAAVPNGNFVGSITASATQPVSAVALADDFGPFASTPVGSGRAK